MTGPEHWREAERLMAEGAGVVAEIRAAKGDETRRDALGKQAMGIWEQAQVHATLALAAATAEQMAARGPGDITVEWRDICYPGADS